MITHSKVVLNEEDLTGIINVLRSGQLVQGKIVSLLEEKIASYIGVNHAVAVSSGTAALHLSLLSLGIGDGSEVIIPSYVCTALLNAIHYVRATPILVDIDPDTYNIDIENIKKPMTVGYLSEMISHKVMATGLSGESQLKTIFVAIFSPIMGYLADSIGIGGGLAVMAIILAILFPLAAVGRLKWTNS